jgi:hypothetical protein
LTSFDQSIEEVVCVLEKFSLAQSLRNHFLCPDHCLPHPEKIGSQFIPASFTITVIGDEVLSVHGVECPEAVIFTGTRSKGDLCASTSAISFVPHFVIDRSPNDGTHRIPPVGNPMVGAE